MDNIEIESVINEINIINSTNDISIENVENNLSLVQEENNIEIETPENNLELVFNQNGANAKINGYNAVEIIAGDNITIDQEEEVLTISATGEPQIQSDYTQADNTKVDYIKNKPTKLSDFTNDGVFITSEDIPEIPTKVSDLEIDIDTDDIPETTTNMYVPTLPVDNPTAKYLNGNKEWATVTGGVTDHTELTNLNGDSDYQHITTAEKAKVNTDYLKLDQTTPQTVVNGMPDFEGGLKVPMSGASSFFASNSPVTYGGIDAYVPPDPEDPEDTGLGAIWYIKGYPALFDDDGTVTPLELVGMTGANTPTINLHITGVNFGTPEEPYWIYLTNYSDLNQADFLVWEAAIFGLGESLVNIYTEVAFTYNSGTDSYTKVSTLPVCSPSTNTTWTDPMAISKISGGFIVSPTTSDLRHNGNYNHLGNYTNNVTTSVFKTKGQIKAGNGNLLDLVTCPITSNPKLDLSGGGGLQFAMTFVPEIISEGTVGTPISRSVYASGVYGTTAFEGGYANYSGTALGIWSAVQNAVSGPTTLQEGVGVRGGMTYSSDTNQEMYVRDMICFQTDFTNLNNGTSKHDNIKHYEAKHLSNNVNSCTNNYGIYIADNSDKATNSWGIYSLEPSNYARKLFVGTTPTKPTEDLEVQGNIKAGGYKSSDGTAGLTATKVFNDGAVVNTVTIKNGLITDWTQV